MLLPGGTHFILFLAALFFLSCKRDATTTSDTTSEEAAYMADYESPNDKWGFMDTTGVLVIRATYDDAGPFSEGLAAVSVQGKWGYINREGKMVIEPVYKSAWAFHEGFARVAAFDSTDIFINRNGQTLQSNGWSAADDFSDGRARVKMGNLYGYIDSTGQLIIQAIYDRGWNFHNGLCVAEYQEKQGAIDISGKYIVPVEYDQIRIAGDNSVILARKENSAFAFNKDGQLLLQMDKAKFVDSDGDVVCVKDVDGMYLQHLIDKTKSPLFSNINYLNQKRWAIKTDSGYQLADQNGQPVASNTYDQINKFSQGVAAYSKDELWGYIGLDGKELTPGVFGLAWDYREGKARAAFRDGIAFIDLHQQLAFYPPNGTLDMRDFSEGLASVQVD